MILGALRSIEKGLAGTWPSYDKRSGLFSPLGLFQLLLQPPVLFQQLLEEPEDEVRGRRAIWRRAGAARGRAGAADLPLAVARPLLFSRALAAAGRSQKAQEKEDWREHHAKSGQSHVAIGKRRY